MITTASVLLSLPPAPPAPVHPQPRELVMSFRRFSAGHSRPSPWPTHPIFHPTTSSPFFQPCKDLPSHSCATALHSACARPGCPSCTCLPGGFSSSLKPPSLPWKLSLSSWLDRAWLLSSVPPLKTRGSSRVLWHLGHIWILVTSGSWALGTRPAHGECKVKCSPKTVGLASNGQ